MRYVMLALFVLVASASVGAAERDSTTLRVTLCSVFVKDQQAALKFYTEVLGFQKKRDLPLGKFRWLTVVSPEAPDGAQLVLEPNANAAAKAFQAAIRKQGIPATSFAVADVQETFEKLTKLGVKFTVNPTKTGSTTIAVFDDTCGNLIQIHQDE